eukprot:15199548-Heterocapsa_arctica.AAC.1
MTSGGKARRGASTTPAQSGYCCLAAHGKCARKAHCSDAAWATMSRIRPSHGLCSFPRLA